MFSCLATVIQQPWKGQNLNLSSDSFLFGFFFCFAVLVIKFRVWACKTREPSHTLNPAGSFSNSCSGPTFGHTTVSSPWGEFKLTPTFHVCRLATLKTLGWKTQAHSEEGFPAKGHCISYMVAISLWPFGFWSAEAHLSLPHTPHSCHHGS